MGHVCHAWLFIGCVVMRTRTLRVVLETGELAGLGGITITSELTLHSDGSLTGTAILLGDDCEVALAATGEHYESIVTAAGSKGGEAAPDAADQRKLS